MIYQKNLGEVTILKMVILLKWGRLYLETGCIYLFFVVLILKKEFGSNSVTIKENLGGLDGNKLKKGDILPFENHH
ncbi:MAG: hypothetical protein U5N10_04715 [Gemmobacter sp.]|nr:hypothetical protein [Gemmobacter sp.]